MVTALDEKGLWSSSGEWLPALDDFRIPLKYLSAMFSAGNEEIVKTALSRQIALRQYKRSQEVDGEINLAVLEKVGLTQEDADNMFRLLSLAFLKERFVLPTTRREEADLDPFIERGFMGFDDMAPDAPLNRREKFHVNPHRDSDPMRSNGNHYVVDANPAHAGESAGE